MRSRGSGALYSKNFLYDEIREIRVPPSKNRHENNKKGYTRGHHRMRTRESGAYCSRHMLNDEIRKIQQDMSYQAMKDEDRELRNKFNCPAMKRYCRKR